jgi:hypothetical protein
MAVVWVYGFPSEKFLGSNPTFDRKQALFLRGSILGDDLLPDVNTDQESSVRGNYFRVRFGARFWRIR